MRRAAHRRDEFGKPVIHQHGVDIRHQFGGVGRQHIAEFAPRRVAMVFSPSASSKISDTEAVPPSTRTAPLQSMPSAVKFANDAVADLVVGAAERSGEGHAPAQPRDGDRGIGGAAAAGDDEFRGRDLGAGRGKILHAHDDVLHRDAGAQDFRSLFCRRAFSQS